MNVTTADTTKNAQLLKAGEQLYCNGRWYIGVECPGCGFIRTVLRLNDYRRARYCRSCALVITHKSKPYKGRGYYRNGYKFVPISLDSIYASMVSPSCKTTTRGYVREHRLVMAKSLGRPLKRNEIVHHLNGVRDDNRIENLVLTSDRKHEYRTLLRVQAKRIKELEALNDIGSI